MYEITYRTDQEDIKEDWDEARSLWPSEHDFLDACGSLILNYSYMMKRHPTREHIILPLLQQFWALTYRQDCRILYGALMTRSPEFFTDWQDALEHQFRPNYNPTGIETINYSWDELADLFTATDLM